MKKKTHGDPKIILYKSRDEIPSNLLQQCMLLRDEASLFYHKFAVEERLANISVFTDFNSYFTNKGQNLYTLQIGSAWSHGYGLEPYGIGIVGVLDIFVDNSKNSCSKDCVWITNLYIKPEYRRFGYASKMVRQMFEDNKNAQFHISVYEGNTEAKKFWKSVGFTKPYSSEYYLNWEGDNNYDND